MLKLGMSLFAIVIMGSVSGCHEAHKLEDKTECREVCSQVNECTPSIDVGNCTDMCGVDSNVDGGYRSKLSDCYDCVHVLDNCQENATNCATRCQGVVDFPTLTPDAG